MSIELKAKKEIKAHKKEEKRGTREAREEQEAEENSLRRTYWITEDTTSSRTNCLLGID